MAQGYLIFHLNLAFSSIKEELRPAVIEKCYWPLLNLIKQMKIPAGIELTGWTLHEINRLDSRWVAAFSEMLKREECELIGSGWTQMIGPLAPAIANRWNQKLGLSAYKEFLNKVPKIVLVNEMAYSSGMVDIYAEAGYQAIIMDRDNVRLALNKAGNKLFNMPTHAQGSSNKSLPVIWGDSILFQRLQRAVHGDITSIEYLDYVKSRAGLDPNPLPIYCNDVEIFDFRPGRFLVEPRLHQEGEWARLAKLFSKLKSEVGIKWVSPSCILMQINSAATKSVCRLSSASYPIPVKKQAKYNIARWALTGRNDLWLNSKCYQLSKFFDANNVSDSSLWRELCELWASDLRTHITDERWEKAILKLNKLQKWMSGMDDLSADLPQQCLSPNPNLPNGVSVTKDSENILWFINTPALNLVFNIRRGLALHSLSFASQEFKPILGSISQGFFDSIELGADFYSGGTLVEIPGERRRLTDLDWVEPKVECDSVNLILTAKLPLGCGNLEKKISISLLEEKISIRYDFGNMERPLGIVRVGLLTLIPSGWYGPISIQTNQGGETETFFIDQDFDYGKPVSTLVSSSSGMAVTEGVMNFLDERGPRLSLRFDPGSCAALAMILHKKSNPSHLTRIAFSLCELDDTSRAGGKMVPFEISLTSPSFLDQAII